MFKSREFLCQSLTAMSRSKSRGRGLFPVQPKRRGCLGGRPYSLCEMCKGLCIERICFSKLTYRPCKIADLAWVNYRYREAGLH